MTGYTINGTSDKPAEAAQLELYAFWNYDLFPGWCSGKVARFSECGKYAFPEKHGGTRVSYFQVIPGARGRLLHDLTNLMHEVRQEQEDRARLTTENACYDLLKELGAIDNFPKTARWHSNGESATRSSPCEDDIQRLIADIKQRSGRSI